MRYKITFSYDGSCFYGSQRQPNLKTVQGEIEKVLTNLNTKKVNMQLAGRTDKDVHAVNQVAHFDLDKKVTLYGLKKLLNKSLNNEIYIKSIEQVPDTFHARYDIEEKTYKYYINTKEYDVFKRNYVYQYNKGIDIDKIKDASLLLLGTHDFRSFCKDDKSKENCIRTINNIDIKKSSGIVEITITGDGFLRKMVRNIVGTLILISEGKKDKEYINELLNCKGSKKALKSAPGTGLYLYNIKYK